MFVLSGYAPQTLALHPLAPHPLAPHPLALHPCKVLTMPLYYVNTISQGLLIENCSTSTGSIWWQCFICHCDLFVNRGADELANRCTESKIQLQKLFFFVIRANISNISQPSKCIWMYFVCLTVKSTINNFLTFKLQSFVGFHKTVELRYKLLIERQLIFENI